jgi:hypothetical protein
VGLFGSVDNPYVFRLQKATLKMFGGLVRSIRASPRVSNSQKHGVFLEHNFTCILLKRSSTIQTNAIPGEMPGRKSSQTHTREA